MAGTASVRKVTLMAATGWPAWSTAALATEETPGVMKESSTAKPWRFSSARRRRSWVSVCGPWSVRRTKLSGRREQRADLGRRELGEQGAAGGGQGGGQAYADVGDQRDRPGRLFLQQIDELTTVQYAEMRGLADLRDQLDEQRPGQSLERIVAQVRRADLERGHPEPVPLLLRQVHDEALVDHCPQQVVRRRARQADRGGDALHRHRSGLGGQERQHPQSAGRGGNVAAHNGSVTAQVSDSGRLRGSWRGSRRNHSRAPSPASATPNSPPAISQSTSCRHRTSGCRRRGTERRRTPATRNRRIRAPSPRSRRPTTPVAEPRVHCQHRRVRPRRSR